MIFLVSISFFVMGLSITSLLIKYDEKNRIYALETKFDSYSIQAFNVFQNRLNRELERLNSLTAVFEFSEDMNKNDFEIFGKSLLKQSSDVLALEWIEIVHAKNINEFKEKMAVQEGTKTFFIKQNLLGSLVKQFNGKDQYAVVKYIYPYEKNKSIVGLDASSNATQHEAMLTASSTKTQVAINAQTLISNPKRDYSVIVYQPVYKDNNSLFGYTAIILDMSHYLRCLQKHSLLEESLRVSIFDSPLGQQSKVFIGKEYSKDSSLYRVNHYHFDFAGERLFMNTSVNLKALPDYRVFTDKSEHKKWVAGSLISFLLALTVFLFLKYLRQSSYAQGSLQKQEELYHKIINQTSDAYYLLDCDGRILDVNRETCLALGYEREELLQKRMSNIDIKYKTEELSDICINLVPRTRILFETIHQRQDGSSIHVEIAATKFKIDDKWVTCAFARDITERIINKALSVDNKELQQSIELYTKQLNKQKETFETLFEKSADGIFITEGRHLLACNQAIVEMFGYPSKAKLLSTPNRVFAPKFQPDGESSHRKGFRMLQVCLEQGSHHYEWVNKKANGQTFWTDVVLTRLEYYGRNVIHIALRDISERKNLEKAMYLAREEAVVANKAKSYFLAKMSHDIRTPLHGILSYAEMGESRVSLLDADKLRRYFNNISQSGHRLMALLDNLLDSAKLESGLMRFDFTHKPLKPIVEICLADQQSLISTKNITIKPTYIDLLAYFDRHRIAQVVSNLLSNAIVFSPFGSTLVLRVEKYNKDFLIFSLQDQGKGVPVEELDLIFDKFIQSQDTDRNTGGTGLGLAISKEIVLAHGGEIWAENYQVGNTVQGAIFKFTLPLNPPKETTLNG